MLQALLINPVAKLDIKDLLESHPSPPSRPSQPAQISRPVLLSSTQLYNNPLSSPSSVSTTSHQSNPVQHETQQQRRPSKPLLARPVLLQESSQGNKSQRASLGPVASDACPSHKRSLPAEDPPMDSPAKKQTKWSAAENAKIIKLRGKNMKWADCSKNIPGRSEIACRLHYQNYLERRDTWDEEKRDKLARVYER